MLKKIVSGAQTGADRGALDAAIKCNIPHGGWVPKGRKAEDGPVSLIYAVKEMPTGSYTKRTEQNVIDSNGTLIFSHGRLSGGSLRTLQYAQKHARPCLYLDMGVLTIDKAADALYHWIRDNKIDILNVAGPRGSKDEKIYDVTKEVLLRYVALEKREGI